MGKEEPLIGVLLAAPDQVASDVSVSVVEDYLEELEELESVFEESQTTLYMTTAHTEEFRNLLSHGAQVIHQFGSGVPEYMAKEGDEEGNFYNTPLKKMLYPSAEGKKKATLDPQGKIKLVVIREAASSRGAEAYVASGIPHVVYFDSALGDDSTSTMKAMYKHLLAGDSLEEAIERATGELSEDLAKCVSVLPEGGDHSFIPFPKVNKGDAELQRSNQALNYMGKTYLDLARTQLSNDNAGNALTNLELAKTYFKEGKLKPGLASTLVEMGAAYRGAGDLCKAIKSIEEAIPIFTKSDNQLDGANALHELGALYRRSNEKAQALDRLNAAEAMVIGLLAVDKANKDARQTHADIMYEMALVTEKQEDSRDLLKKAVDIYMDLGLKAPQADALIELGSVEMTMEEYLDAKANAEHAQSLYNSFGMKLGEAEAYVLLGNIHWALGELKTAGRRYVAAYNIYKEENDTEGIKTAKKLVSKVRRALPEGDTVSGISNIGSTFTGNTSTGTDFQHKRKRSVQSMSLPTVGENSPGKSPAPNSAPKPNATPSQKGLWGLVKNVFRFVNGAQEK